MKASPMFNCLPGTMLSWRRMHEWSLGRSCGRALLNDTADLAASHRLFNPVQRWPRFLVLTGRGPGVDLISALEFEQVFEKLYQTSQRALFDINSSEAQHYRRYLLQRRTEARRMGEQPAQTYNRMPQCSPSPAEVEIPDGIGRAPRGINDGKGLVFISHLAKSIPADSCRFPVATCGGSRWPTSIATHRFSASCATAKTWKESAARVSIGKSAAARAPARSR